MYWAERDGTGSVPPDPGLDAASCLTIYEAPLPALARLLITRSPYAKPLAMTLPIDAKAGCLYPNNARALLEARSRGFDNACSPTCSATSPNSPPPTSSWRSDGVVMTPVANGSFLNGVTRQRLLTLLRADGAETREATLRFADFDSGDEIFVVGNYGKVVPVKRFEGRKLPPGPPFRRARASSIGISPIRAQ